MEASTDWSGSLEEDEIPDMDVRNTFFPTEPAPWGAGLGVALEQRQLSGFLGLQRVEYLAWGCIRTQIPKKSLQDAVGSGSKAPHGHGFMSPLCLSYYVDLQPNRPSSLRLRRDSLSFMGGGTMYARSKTWNFRPLVS